MGHEFIHELEESFELCLLQLTLILQRISVRTLSPLLVLSATLLFAAVDSNASETITINQTKKAPLFDGRCGKDEWQTAT